MVVDNTFSFGGISSSDFQITYDTERHLILPEKRKYTQEIIGYDGVADFDIPGYDVSIFTLSLYFEGDFADLRANEDAITSWLYNSGSAKRLIFGNRPDRYYLAKVYAALDFTNTKTRQIGTVQFECNPPWCYLLDGTLQSPEMLEWTNCSFQKENQFYKEFTKEGTIRFYNVGRPVKPVIKVIGSISKGFTLFCDGRAFIIETDIYNDGIKIDCESETVIRMSNGENLSPFITVDEFIELPSGKVSIDVTAPHIGEYPQNLTVFVEMTVSLGV